jgi:hypothetical protein
VSKQEMRVFSVAPVRTRTTNVFPAVTFKGAVAPLVPAVTINPLVALLTRAITAPDAGQLFDMSQADWANSNPEARALRKTIDKIARSFLIINCGSYTRSTQDSL